MGREYTGPCAERYADVSQCSFFRCFTFYMYSKYAGYKNIINSFLPSDIGSNIGSYSVAVAGMHPAREVMLPPFSFCFHLLPDLTFLLPFVATIHTLVASILILLTLVAKIHKLLPIVALLPKFLLPFIASIHPLVALQVIAVDADAENLAYIR